MQGRDFGLEFMQKGYRFVEYDPILDIWAEVLGDDMLGTRQLEETMDPSLTRLLAVVLLFASFGFVFVAYLVLWAVLPRHDGVATTLDEVRGRVSGSSRGRILGLLLALAVAAIVFGGVFDGQTGTWLVPLALIVGGAALLSRRGDDAPVEQGYAAMVALVPNQPTTGLERSVSGVAC